MTVSGTTSATSRLDMTSASARKIGHFFCTYWFRVVLLTSAALFTSLPTRIAHAGNSQSSQKPEKPKKKKGGFTFFVQGKRPKIKFGHGNRAREAVRKLTGHNAATGERKIKKQELKDYRRGGSTPPRIAAAGGGSPSRSSLNRPKRNVSPASSNGRRRGSNELTVRHPSPQRGASQRPSRIPGPRGSTRRGRR